MTAARYLGALRRLAGASDKGNMPDIERHILRNHKGSEENVKAKIILPLLTRLGWDIVEDCYFAEEMADIFVEHDGKPAFIIETKGWEQGFDYAQGLEYSVKLKTPWVVFTSGQITEVHHALIMNANRTSPEPVLYVDYPELRKEPDIFDQYLALSAFKDGFPALRGRCQAMLPSPHFGKPWPETEAAYKVLCEGVGFHRAGCASRMTHEEFEEALCTLPPDIQAVYRGLIDSIRNIAKGSARLQCRTSTQGLILQSVDVKREKVGRAKWMMLLEVSPHQRRVAKGMESWRALGLGGELLSALKKVKAPRDAREGQEIVALLAKCLAAVGCVK